MKSIIALAVLAFSLVAFAQQESHHDQVNKNGDHVMGFSHEKTTHHFLLYPDGGAIQVEANNADDSESRDQIQAHLPHIAKMFTAGDFQAPMLVHGKTPPGVETLVRLKSEVTYTYEKLPKGGRVSIVTANKEALEAVYTFLRFQISDHKTGDSTKVQEERPR
jgi:hypothetical protein